MNEFRTKEELEKVLFEENSQKIDEQTNAIEQLQQQLQEAQESADKNEQARRYMNDLFEAGMIVVNPDKSVTVSKDGSLIGNATDQEM